MKTLVLFAGAASFAASVLLAQDAQRPNAPSVKVIQGGDSAQDFGRYPSPPAAAVTFTAGFASLSPDCPTGHNSQDRM